MLTIVERYEIVNFVTIIDDIGEELNTQISREVNDKNIGRTDGHENISPSESNIRFHTTQA